jgi:hypothetical protein
MIELMIGIVLLCGLLYIIGKVKDCGYNPEYESWLTEDKANYPELYK